MRQDASFRPLHDRARLRLLGPDRKRFLHGMVTNDINGLRPGQGCAAAMLTVKGKMIADLVVYECGDEGLWLAMEGSVGARVHEALERHLIMDDVTVSDLSAELGQLGVYGDSAPLAAALGAAVPDLPPFHHAVVDAAADAPGAPLRLCRTPELGVPGWHLFGPRPVLAQLAERLAQAGAAPLSDEEAEVLRVAAGVPRYGLDIDEERLPQEANLDHAISFQKGCYLGQEVIARLSARGHINRKLVGLRFPAGAVPPRGTALSHESREAAGTVMSGVISPRLGAIALGYVHRSLWEPGTALRDATGATALVTPLPFPEKWPHI